MSFKGCCGEWQSVRTFSLLLSIPDDRRDTRNSPFHPAIVIGINKITSNQFFELPPLKHSYVFCIYQIFELLCYGSLRRRKQEPLLPALPRRGDQVPWSHSDFLYEHTPANPPLQTHLLPVCQMEIAFLGEIKFTCQLCALLNLGINLTPSFVSWCWTHMFIEGKNISVQARLHQMDKQNIISKLLQCFSDHFHL